MGAQLWFHTTGPHNSPRDALRELQTEELTNYNLARVIQEQLESARSAVAATEGDDEYGLLEEYQEEVLRLEGIAAEGVPNNEMDKINLLRRIHAHSGQGVGNILDVIDVNDDGGVLVARPCTSAELQNLIGSDRPTRAETKRIIFATNERLDRGESICFQVYSDDRSASIGWCFIGNTID